jgi:AMP-polyphosphate phosphotransferase
MHAELKDYESTTEFDGDYEAEWERLHAELIQAQLAITAHQKNAIVVVEGVDSLGKSDLFQTLTQGLDPRRFKVWDMGQGDGVEAGRHFLWRYWQKLPASGEITVLDGSWYSRVLLDRVEGHVNEATCKRAYDEINEFEAQQKENGTALIKLFVHLNAEEQERRLKARTEDSWQSALLKPSDFRLYRHRADYVEAVEDMFAATNTRWAPWTIINGNEPLSCRISAMKAVLAALTPLYPTQPPEPLAPMQEEAEAAFGAGFMLRDS